MDKCHQASICPVTRTSCKCRPSSPVDSEHVEPLCHWESDQSSDGASVACSTSGCCIDLRKHPFLPISIVATRCPDHLRDRLKATSSQLPIDRGNRHFHHWHKNEYCIVALDEHYSMGTEHPSSSSTTRTRPSRPSHHRRALCTGDQHDGIRHHMVGCIHSTQPKVPTDPRLTCHLQL